MCLHININKTPQQHSKIFIYTLWNFAHKPRSAAVSLIALTSYKVIYILLFVYLQDINTIFTSIRHNNKAGLWVNKRHLHNIYYHCYCSPYNLRWRKVFSINDGTVSTRHDIYVLYDLSSSTRLYRFEADLIFLYL